MNYRRKLVAFILSISMVVSFFTSFSKVSATTVPDYCDYLQKLGLIVGTGDGMQLERTATRVEISIMLVRILGQERTVLSGNYPHVFKDVDPWATNYIGYLYKNKITSGISSSKYGSTDIASAAQYITQILRALGYRDSIDGFSWDNCFLKAQEVGLLTAAMAVDLQKSASLTRSQMISVTYHALFAMTKGADVTLIEKLYKQGTISIIALQEICADDKRLYNIVSTFADLSEDGETTTFVTIQDLSQKATVYVEMGPSSGSYAKKGSGVIVSTDGLVAVAYKDLVEGCISGRATVDGKTFYSVESIVAYDTQANLAVLKLKGKNFDSFPLSSNEPIKNDAIVYSASKYKDYTVSFTKGKITKSSLVIGQSNYIQTDIPISIEHCGGALLNEKGELIAFSVKESNSGANMGSMISIDEYNKLMNK